MTRNRSRKRLAIALVLVLIGSGFSAIPLAAGDTANATMSTTQTETEYWISGSDDGTLKKLDSTGTVVWSRDLGSPVRGTTTDPNGNVYALTESGDLFQYDSNGNQQWSQPIGGAGFGVEYHDDRLYTITVKSGFTVKEFTTGGSENWNFSRGSNGAFGQSIDVGPNGYVYAAGGKDGAYVLNNSGSEIYSHLYRSDAVTTNGSHYWFGDSDNNAVHGYQRSNGTQFTNFSVSYVAYGMGYAPDDTLRVTMANGGSLETYEPDGTLLNSVDNGDLDVAISPNNEMIVGDRSSNNGPRVYDSSLSLMFNASVHSDDVWTVSYVRRPSGSQIDGQVTDNAGDPIESAEVDAYDSNGELIAQTTTDSNGQYSLSLEDGEYEIEARASGYSANTTTVTVAGSDITGVDFTLQGYLLEGTVTDRTGEPIADASVTIINESTGDTVERLVTDSSGQYEYQLTENGTYRVRAVHDNVQANKTVNYTTPGETVNLQLDKYYASGDVTVVNASGELIDNQSISLDFSSTESDYETSWGMSDGYAKLDDAFDDASHPNNETYELTVSTSGYRNRTVMINDTKGSFTVTLNDENSSHWSQEVNLIDHTGLFDLSESYLIVEASDSDSSSWEVVDGTHFGLDEPTIQIREGETYRLYVQNENGDRATAGELVPEDWSDDPDHIVTVTVGSEDSDNPVDRNEGDDDDDTVHFDNPPIADFEVSTDNPIVGEEVALNGTLSRDLESGVQSYRWYVDGEQVATGATPTWTPSNNGVHEVTLEVEDDQGQTDSESKSVFVGANDMFTLYIRDQANPEELINGTNVTVSVTFYAGNETITRTTSDGSIDLTGLPADETLVATARADGWQNRRILIRDITRQQSIYLFRDNTSAAEVTFLLEDKTGNFPSTSSQLIIQRSMNYSGTSGSEWQTVLGDYFAADQSFTATLETGQRYRLIIRNDEGDQRVLGSYIAEESETTTLTIGTIVWDPGDDENVQFDARLRQDEDQLRLEYNDSAQTDRLEITVYERGNESNVIYETTEHNIGEYVETLPLTDNESDMNLVVEVYGNRSGEDFNLTVQLGEVPEQPLPIDSRWLSLMGQVLIVATTGLVAGVLHRTGGIIVVSMAFVLSWFGWVVIHPAALGFAGFLALFSAVKPLGGG